MEVTNLQIPVSLTEGAKKELKKLKDQQNPGLETSRLFYEQF